MECSGKHDTTWNIPRSITFSPLHFMLYRGKSISYGTVDGMSTWSDRELVPQNWLKWFVKEGSQTWSKPVLKRSLDSQALIWITWRLIGKFGLLSKPEVSELWEDRLWWESWSSLTFRERLATCVLYEVCLRPFVCLLAPFVFLPSSANYMCISSANYMCTSSANVRNIIIMHT